MAYDLNPHFGTDKAFVDGARRVADFLWEATEGDPSAFPPSYLENLRHQYENGKVSMVEFIDKVDLGPDASYEDYREVVDLLLCVDPNKFNHGEGIVELQPDQLRYSLEEPDFDFSEFEFDFEEIVEEEVVAEGPGGIEAEGSILEEQDPFSDKMELFLKKVISSVYMDGVTAVTDLEGNPPNAANNYLLADDGKSFSGIFYDTPEGEEGKKYPFQIKESGPDQWQIKY